MQGDVNSRQLKVESKVFGEEASEGNPTLSAQTADRKDGHPGGLSGSRGDWIRAKARSETGSLRLRTKASGKEGAFADDDYRV
jgi:hypothetical protein